MIDQVIWARAIVPFLVYDWSYILIQVSQVSPHALNQRSPARSGIENRWPKGKAIPFGVGRWVQGVWSLLAKVETFKKRFKHR